MTKKAAKQKERIKSRHSANGSSGFVVNELLVTPEMAGDLLGRNPRNRKLGDRTVRRYARDMAAGKWRSNAETIKIDEHGNILDGQHRLAAVVYANTAVRMLVVSNIPADVGPTIDTGKARSLGDVLHIAGRTSPGHLAPALQALHRYRTGGAFTRAAVGSTPTHQDLSEGLLVEEPRLANHIGQGYALSRKLQGGVGLMSALSYVLSEIDEDDAFLFFDSLLTGADLRQNDPIHRLRERLIDRQRTLGPNEVAALVFKAWNMFRKHETVKVLAWKASKEPMPEPK